MKLLSDKLNLNPQTILPFSTKAGLSGSLRFDEFLTTLTKQGYLQKVGCGGLHREQNDKLMPACVADSDYERYGRRGQWTRRTSVRMEVGTSS